jgi:hypothetical protein
MKYLKKFNESYSKDDLLDVLINLNDYDCDVRIIGFDESLPISKQNIIIKVTKDINLKYSNYDSIYNSKGYTEELFHRQYIGSYSEEIEINDSFLPQVKNINTNRRSGKMKELEEKEYNFILKELIILYRFLYGEFNEFNDYMKISIHFSIIDPDELRSVDNKTNKTRLFFVFRYMNIKVD